MSQPTEGARALRGEEPSEQPVVQHRTVQFEPSKPDPLTEVKGKENVQPAIAQPAIAHSQHQNTVSGASGEALRREFEALQLQQKKERITGRLSRSKSANSLALESSAPLQIVRRYDNSVQPFINAGYDFLQLSSGRDKVLSFMQNFAKVASDSFCAAGSDSNLVYRAVESNISDGRKVFRFFKWWREVYKVRRGIYRYQSGRDANGTAWCIDAVCGIMDTFGHFFSFFYFLLDNMLWAVNVGLLKAKATPRFVRDMNDLPANGPVVSLFGGIRGMKTWKDRTSYSRTIVAFAANVLLFVKAAQVKHARRVKNECNAGEEEALGAERETEDEDSEIDSPSPAIDGPTDSRWWGRLALAVQNVTFGDVLALSTFTDPDDPVLFHTLELIGIYCNYSMLSVKLRLTSNKLSATRMGLLGMVAALTGIWRNWRKVLRKRCGAKSFQLDT